MMDLHEDVSALEIFRKAKYWGTTARSGQDRRCRPTTWLDSTMVQVQGPETSSAPHVASSAVPA